MTQFPKHTMKHIFKIHVVYSRTDQQLILQGFPPPSPKRYQCTVSLNRSQQYNELFYPTMVREHLIQVIPIQQVGKVTSSLLIGTNHFLLFHHSIASPISLAFYYFFLHPSESGGRRKPVSWNPNVIWVSHVWFSIKNAASSNGSEQLKRNQRRQLAPRAIRRHLPEPPRKGCWLPPRAPARKRRSELGAGVAVAPQNCIDPSTLSPSPPPPPSAQPPIAAFSSGSSASTPRGESTSRSSTGNGPQPPTSAPGCRLCGVLRHSACISPPLSGLYWRTENLSAAFPHPTPSRSGMARMDDLLAQVAGLRSPGNPRLIPAGNS